MRSGVVSMECKYIPMLDVSHGFEFPLKSSVSFGAPTVEPLHGKGSSARAVVADHQLVDGSVTAAADDVFACELHCLLEKSLGGKRLGGEGSEEDELAARETIFDDFSLPQPSLVEEK